MRLLQPFTILCLFSAGIDAAEEDYKNVYGNSLQSCSQDGMALTGYTRTGYCVDQNDDGGSHHICIDLSSASGGNFCDVTGQSDWCSSEMPCQEDSNENCQVQQWCVCQWAFASYLSSAGGCDEIQDIVCESINLEALYGYWSHIGQSKYQTALDCIVDRCGVENELYMSRSSSSSTSAWVFAGVMALVAVSAVTLWTRKRAIRRGAYPPLREDLVPPIS